MHVRRNCWWWWTDQWFCWLIKQNWSFSSFSLNKLLCHNIGCGQINTWIPLTVTYLLHPVSMQLFCDVKAMMIPLLINVRMPTIHYTHNRPKSRDDSNTPSLRKRYLNIRIVMMWYDMTWWLAYLFTNNNALLHIILAFLFSE